MNPKASRYFTYIRPILRSKYTKTYSSLIFSLITIAVFSVYAIRPTVSTILSLQKSIEEQSGVLKTLQEKVNNLAQGKRNYESINPSVKNKLDNLIPDNPALPRLINSLVLAANQAEASVSGLQFQPVELNTKKNLPLKTAPINEVDFSLNAQGSFANLMELLSILKRADRLIKITSVNFVQPLNADLIMSINGKAFYITN